MKKRLIKKIKELVNHNKSDIMKLNEIEENLEEFSRLLDKLNSDESKDRLFEVVHYNGINRMKVLDRNGFAFFMNMVTNNFKELGLYRESSE